jgi:hypothetical protein
MLPPELIMILEAAVREMADGDGEPQRAHLARILDWIRLATFASGRPELAEVPLSTPERKCIGGPEVSNDPKVAGQIGTPRSSHPIMRRPKRQPRREASNPREWLQARGTA